MFAICAVRSRWKPARNCRANWLPLVQARRSWIYRDARVMRGTGTYAETRRDRCRCLYSTRFERACSRLTDLPRNCWSMAATRYWSARLGLTGMTLRNTTANRRAAKQIVRSAHTTTTRSDVRQCSWYRDWIGVILTMTMVLFTAVAIVREREHGRSRNADYNAG